MKTLPPAMKTDLESKAYIQALLLDFDNVGAKDFKFTTWGTRVLHSSTLYEPHGMLVNNISSSSSQIVDRVRIALDDTNREIINLLGRYDLGEYPVTITFVVLDHIGKVKASLIIFKGDLTQWEYQPRTLSTVVSSIFYQLSRVTTSQYSCSCRWRKFKGTECGYSDEGLKCDRTYDQCVAYGNEVNFGGFRWLPSLVKKRIAY
jgi:hypothetical protein